MTMLKSREVVPPIAPTAMHMTPSHQMTVAALFSIHASLKNSDYFRIKKYVLNNYWRITTHILWFSDNRTINVQDFCGGQAACLAFPEWAFM